MAESRKISAAVPFREMVQTLVSVIEEKDVFIRGHSERVASHCVRFSAGLGLSKPEVEQILLAGLLHDIGMVYIPAEIIQKPDRLTADEMLKVKQHPIIAEKVLSNLELLKGVLPLIRHHHESFDGGGYPDSLKGEEIPMGARILRLVDSWDAMTSPRPHRPSLRPEAALQEIREDAGHQFDSRLVEAFLDYVKRGGKAREHIAGNGNQGITRKIVIDIAEKFMGGEGNLPILPKVFQEIQRIMDDPKSTIPDLAKAAERDAAIAVKLISVANSALYRGTERIVTVREAVPRLGFNETRNVLSTLALKGLYEPKEPLFRQLAEKVWSHSLACALAARLLARKLAIGEEERYFQMGILHDIGKPPLLKLLSERDIGAASFELEEIVESIDEVHTSFGGTLLQRWGFPEDFVRVATRHEGPSYSPRTEQTILVVNLANHIAHNAGYGLLEPVKKTDFSTLESAKRLQVDVGTAEAVCKETAEAMESIYRFV